MNYPINLEGFEGQSISVQTASFLAGPKLLVNGQTAAKGPKRNQMLLRRNDGREVVADWKPQFMGLDVPQIVVDGSTVSVTEPLKWYVWVWSGLPIILILIGGLIGAVAGMIGFSINTSIFRSAWPAMAKFGLTAIVSLTTVVAYISLAALFISAVGR
ncbi:hypothetical protein K2Z83_24825 [Oscillochloris sp. ZM17-4]|uniref:hypothetical protein n=1 Tax=Oscillochloris sp. ZM17-4 TaxID=2866714 RepID=UPI001C72F5C8|nr:hypothetical protein [Oscillochloris sp. ZM17-4]MBX0330885.1 hypothetical protein [Oscillochloris sp. ZM17-4]